MRIAEAEWNRCISGTRRLIAEAQAAGDAPFERALRKMLDRLQAERLEQEMRRRREAAVESALDDDPQHIGNIVAKVVKRLGHPAEITPLRLYTYWQADGYGYWTSEKIGLRHAQRIVCEGEA
jgi:hypothetical protein